MDLQLARSAVPSAQPYFPLFLPPSQSSTSGWANTALCRLMMRMQADTAWLGPDCLARPSLPCKGAHTNTSTGLVCRAMGVHVKAAPGLSCHAMVHDITLAWPGLPCNYLARFSLGQAGSTPSLFLLFK
jgi:hypothetical protein